VAANAGRASVCVLGAGSPARPHSVLCSRTKRIQLGALATLAVAVALGACALGYQHGVQVERRAWLATEQTVTLPPPSVAADGRILQRPRVSTGRTFYTYPHSGQTFFASFGPPPVNVPDLRDTPTQ
jgi:hypothetical protein